MTKQFTFFLCLFYISNAFSQSEKFDIATFVPPHGWQRLDSAGVLAFHNYRTAGGLTSFGQIILFPSWASNNSPIKNFEQEWNNKVVNVTGAKTKPVTQSEKTPDGWTMVTGSANISVQGLNYTCLLVTLSGFSKAMSVMVNTSGSDYAAAIQNFFNELNLDTGTIIAANLQHNRSKKPSTNMSRTITLNDYDYIAPDGWQVQRQTDQVIIQNMESGCRIQMLEPQASSGNLEQEAQGVFDMMYTGWQYREVGEKRYTLSKGYLTKGLAYAMIEASMGRTTNEGQYQLEDGVAVVVKANDQIVIIAVRHNSSFLGHSDCLRKYETLGRFFNSFAVRNTISPKDAEESPSKRIIGVWKLTSTGMALGEYIFAANGHYKFGGAVGSSSTTSDYNYEYLHITTYSFEGDGSYSIEGNRIYLRKRGDSNPEEIQFRFTKVNHGGSDWKDRLYMLKRDTTLGGNYEVCCEKMDR